MLSTTFDLEEDFIEMPSVARSRKPVTQSVGGSLTELKAPFSDGFIAEGDTAH
jgi:hypothetical protein